MKKVLLMLLIVNFTIIQSCTDLDPEVYNEILPEDYFENEAQLLAFTASAYKPLQGWWDNIALTGDAMSDVATVPIRSNGGWDDGNVWPRYMSRDWAARDWSQDRPWNIAFNGTATCNRLIEFLDELGDVDPGAVAELRALRAFYLWVGLDNFGNIPVELRFAEADPQPAQKTPAEAFEIIEDELLTAIPDLKESKDVTTYAKVNKWVAYMVLAKLYINAGRYGVEPHYKEAADAVQAITNSGLYDIEAGYFANFRINNEGSKENMFVVPYDRTNMNSFNIPHMALHQSAGPTFGYSAAPWGGFSVQEDFYNSFDDEDNRKGMFIVGQQYSQAAGPGWSDTEGFFYANPAEQHKLYNCDEDFNQFSAGEREQLGWPPNSDGDNFEDACNIFITPSYKFTVGEEGVRPNITPYRHGARYGKYELEQNVPPGLNNDCVIFRYGEALLIRAEALWRQNSGDAEALMIVNQIRNRAGIDQDLSSLTEDDLYQEFKKELALEGQAREITIRFGHWEDEWMLKTDSDPRKRWYPIPQAQIDANPNLKQVDYLSGE
ncbi:MAG: RagB/SusD family nutrient uptake outer membrane protein [Cytophagales bacterium]|nr:RagB/SusD family nutrient uptake outer membrane protein [Cytophagales bacterium]